MTPRRELLPLGYEFPERGVGAEPSSARPPVELGASEHPVPDATWMWRSARLAMALGAALAVAWAIGPEAWSAIGSRR